MKALLSEIGTFAWKVLRRWQALVTGSIAIALLFAAAAAGLKIPRLVQLLVAVLAFLPATFLVWRDERRAGAALRDRRPEPIIFETSDEIFWLLTKLARHGLRREMHEARRGGDTNSIWIGDTPIDFYDSQWFYELVEKGQRRGLLEMTAGGGVHLYRLTDEGRRSLDTDRDRCRVAVPPANRVLINSLSGAEEPNLLR
jgi:hypothetical protein